MSNSAFSSPTKTEGSGMSKRPSVKWTEEEQRVLVAAIAGQDTTKINWADVSRLLPYRTGKQCREKWKNDLRPDINKDPWTSQEEYVLARLHAEVGNQWAEIAKYLNGRSENSIKNHWNATLRSKASAKGRTLLGAYGRLVLEKKTTSIETFEKAKDMYSKLKGVEPLEAITVPEEFFQRRPSQGSVNSTPVKVRIGAGTVRPGTAGGGALAAAARALPPGAASRKRGKWDSEESDADVEADEAGSDSDTWDDTRGKRSRRARDSASAPTRRTSVGSLPPRAPTATAVRHSGGSSFPAAAMATGAPALYEHAHAHPPHPHHAYHDHEITATIKIAGGRPPKASGGMGYSHPHCPTTGFHAAAPDFAHAHEAAHFEVGLASSGRRQAAVQAMHAHARLAEFSDYGSSDYGSCTTTTGGGMFVPAEHFSAGAMRQLSELEAAQATTAAAAASAVHSAVPPPPLCQEPELAMFAAGLALPDEPHEYCTADASLDVWSDSDLQLLRDLTEGTGGGGPGAVAHGQAHPSHTPGVPDTSPLVGSAPPLHKGCAMGGGDVLLHPYSHTLGDAGSALVFGGGDGMGVCVGVGPGGGCTRTTIDYGDVGDAACGDVVGGVGRGHGMRQPLDCDTTPKGHAPPIHLSHGTTTGGAAQAKLMLMDGSPWGLPGHRGGDPGGDLAAALGHGCM